MKVPQIVWNKTDEPLKFKVIDDFSVYDVEIIKKHDIESINITLYNIVRKYYKY